MVCSGHSAVVVLHILAACTALWSLGIACLQLAVHAAISLLYLFVSLWHSTSSSIHLVFPAFASFDYASYINVHQHTCQCVAGLAEDIGRHALVYGRRISKAEMFARIDAVDGDTIKAVSDRFIYDQDIAIAAMGDTQNLPDYTWFRRRTYWLRY